MSSMRPAPSAPADPFELAFGRLEDALRAAVPGDPATVEPVVLRLAELNRTLAGRPVAAERYAAVRAAIDEAMAGVAGLLGSLAETRDEVGATLARVRARRRGPGPGAYRSLDVSS